jgi:GNAT superfamily N-acetyltransferase
MIRKYQPSDREECRGLWRELTEWHREIYDDPNIGGEHPEDYFDKHLAKVGPDNLWIAIYDAKVVGLTGLIVEDNETEIEPLIVSRAYRGKGIGESLIEKVVSEAREIGTKILCIKPAARNIKTIKFLYKQGFKNLGEIELFMSFTEYVWKPGPEIHGCKLKF